MCNAFSAICPETGDIIWELGVDSHSDLVDKGGVQDNTNDPTLMTFAKIEITPVRRDYRAALLHYSKSGYSDRSQWKFRVDQDATPNWWSAGYEESCWDAHKSWCKQLNNILDCETVIANPFRDIKPPKRVTKKHIQLLREWNSVRNSVRHTIENSVRYSVRRSVGASVGYSVWTSVEHIVWSSVGTSVMSSVWSSVGDSVGDSVGGSVWNSVRDSVDAQIGSLSRLSRDKWLYTKDIPGTGYPLQPAVDLWNLGLVPSFDGKIWRLHGGPEAEVLWEETFE